MLMAVPENAGKLHIHRFFLIERKSGKILGDHTWECPDSSLSPKRYYCYGECDGGIISIEQDGRINFKTSSIRIDKTTGTFTESWEIFPAKETDLPAPAPLSCPAEIASIQLDPNADNETYIKNQINTLVTPVHYICYSRKESLQEVNRSIYHGCRFTRIPCNSHDTAWHTFGKYPNEKEAMKAFERCRRSK